MDERALRAAHGQGRQKWTKDYGQLQRLLLISYERLLLSISCPFGP